MSIQAELQKAVTIYLLLLDPVNLLTAGLKQLEKLEKAEKEERQ